MKRVGWFCVIVGALMIVQWGFFLAAGMVPELRTEPIRIAFHLAAEAATALILLIAGAALLRGAEWALPVSLVGQGMLVYTVIVSPGYFAQLGQWLPVGMFAVLFIAAVNSIWVLAKSKAPDRS